MEVETGKGRLYVGERRKLRRLSQFMETLKSQNKCELNPMNDWEAKGIREQTSDELYLFFFDEPYLGIIILTFPDLLL